MKPIFPPNVSVRQGDQPSTPRYIVDQRGTDVRPFRVFDTQKRQAIIFTADETIANRMAEEYEKQWRRSTWLRRTIARVKRALRRAGRRQQQSAVAEAEPVWKQKLRAVDEICNRHRATSR